ncbi:hypothetical protein ACIOWE_04430 [Pseudomonas sp. NPDC087598]|uniref:hypothetical protein n=1 Tax=Pseudomonas sp. NPDC087598 TaxID=3364440 RepID=UPI0037FDCFDC
MSIEEVTWKTVLSGVGRTYVGIQDHSERLKPGSKAAAFSHLIVMDANAIWGDRRSAAAEVESMLRSPQSTTNLTYLGKFN